MTKDIPLDTEWGRQLTRHLSAVEKAEQCKAEVKEAQDRLWEALERAATTRKLVIEALPRGAGQEVAELLPWDHLSYYARFNDEKPRWYTASGGLITHIVEEACQLAHILGRPVKFLTKDSNGLNGVDVIIKPGEDVETVWQRWSREMYPNGVHNR